MRIDLDRDDLNQAVAEWVKRQTGLTVLDEVDIEITFEADEDGDAYCTGALAEVETIAATATATPTTDREGA